jgi:hypothetical protein
MSDLPIYIRGHRETFQAKESARATRAAEVWQELEDERRAVEERTARLRAMRLARGGREA